MMTEDGVRSRSHGLSRKFIEAQAVSLGIPVTFVPTTWDQYEARMIAALRAARIRGARFAIFGAIDILEHRQWIDRVCSEAGMEARLPLWRMDRKTVLDQLEALHFMVVISTVRANDLDKSLIGRPLDRETRAAIVAQGADECGENGEFHTAVTSGPDFKIPVELTSTQPVFHGGCWTLSE
jgi:uncharacterized protein (TIGR00290 family)